MMKFLHYHIDTNNNEEGGWVGEQSANSVKSSSNDWKTLHASHAQHKCLNNFTA